MSLKMTPGGYVLETCMQALTKTREFVIYCFVDELYEMDQETKDITI